MAINTDTVLISHDEIEQMLDRVSAELNRDYNGEPLVVVGILTGAFIFTADLVRRLDMPVIVDFMQVSSYVGEYSTGELKIKKDMSYDIKDMNVLIVEDIISIVGKLSLYATWLVKIAHTYTLDVYILRIDTLKNVVQTASHISETKESYIQVFHNLLSIYKVRNYSI
jgi:hypoxanthine phosphoribosyltransferase